MNKKGSNPPPPAPRKKTEAKNMIFKFIHIENRQNEMFEGHPVYRIYNNKTFDQLGVISYYKSWKQYVFSSCEQCVFNDFCLKNVLEFMRQL